MKLLFQKFAKYCATKLASANVFVGAIVLVLVWIATGPLFHFSDVWQLLINSFTSVVTFLMIFLVQNAQNRDTAAIQLKLDEIIRSIKEADNKMINLEERTDEEIETIREKFVELPNNLK